MKRELVSNFFLSYLANKNLSYLASCVLLGTIGGAVVALVYSRDYKLLLGKFISSVVIFHSQRIQPRALVKQMESRRAG